MEYVELLKEAKKMQKKAYAPYSNIYVGAALLSKSGKIFTGCNVENASFGATICAERVAFIKAISEGEKDFSAIAITSNLNDPIYPCGICRQVIVEFAPHIDVVLEGDTHPIVMNIAALLPNAFSQNGIPK